VVIAATHSNGTTFKAPKLGEGDRLSTEQLDAGRISTALQRGPTVRRGGNMLLAQLTGSPSSSQFSPKSANEFEWRITPAVLPIRKGGMKVTAIHTQGGNVPKRQSSSFIRRDDR
jgi:hypothetical protein